MFNRKITNQLEHAALKDLKEGDVIFISIGVYPFTQVAHGTGSWCSHVGFVVKEKGQWFVLESAVPFVRKTPLRKFIKRTNGYDLSIRRLPRELSNDEITELKNAAEKRMGKLYHTGFNYDSSRQFCSKFVYQVYKDALGIELGEIQTLEALLEDNPQANMSFWKTWYFGFIPWQRRTITPHSQLIDPQLVTVLSLRDQQELMAANS